MVRTLYFLLSFALLMSFCEVARAEQEIPSFESQFGGSFDDGSRKVFDPTPLPPFDSAPQSLGDDNVSRLLQRLQLSCGRPTTNETKAEVCKVCDKDLLAINAEFSALREIHDALRAASGCLSASLQFPSSYPPLEEGSLAICGVPDSSSYEQVCAACDRDYLELNALYASRLNAHEAARQASGCLSTLGIPFAAPVRVITLEPTIAPY